MKKKFNDTGLCIPDKHYMVDTTPQLKECIELIEEGKYFVINRPRQYGKTTTINLLEKTPLLEDYMILRMSFEGVGDLCFKNDPAFVGMFIRKIEGELKFLKIDKPVDVLVYNEKSTLENLSTVITNFIEAMDKKVVLLIDEVDKSSNNQLFVNFLALLRDKYLLMNSGRDSTFHSIVLAGLHDVKNLKLKLRQDDDAIYNSPWNIAVSYDVDMTFKAKQIETMLVDYVNATQKCDSLPNMDIAFIAEKLYYHTSGYPYFVSKLCKIIDEKIKPEKWEEIHILEAIKILLREKNNSNIDTVKKNIENNEELRNFIQSIILNNVQYSYYSQIPLIEYSIMHGLIREKNNYAEIFNSIYNEFLTEYLVERLKTKDASFDNIQAPYLKSNGNLDIELLLTKFKDAVEEKYSKSDLMKSKEFLENDLRMKFFMFLKPVINGIGFVFKEVQISEEKRLDAIIIFNNEKFIIELKLWKGSQLHKQGIEQIKDYMKREKVDKGYMIIMNKNISKEYKTTNEDGIFTAWV